MKFDRDAWIRQIPGNGRIPMRMLKVVMPEQYDPDLRGPAMMQPLAADAMGAMILAARAAGVAFSLKYSYRTFAKQQEKWENYEGPDGVIGTLDDGNLAATPGTSNHGLALSGDLTNLYEDNIRWLRNNSMRFGFRFDVPGEIWHATFQDGFEWKPGSGEAEMLEDYVTGEELYRKRAREQGKDPGDPPSDRNKWFKAGWNSARWGYNNPKQG